MHLERVLQIGVAILVSLSTILLGMGEQGVTLPLVAVILAAASVYLTDMRGWIRLNQRATDVLALGAGILALVQWQRDVNDAGLLALLNFAVYCQFVLQFKRKNVLTYWLLIALSLMEAAVATALNETMLFGVLLLAYVMLGIGVLTLFYLQREQWRAAARVETANRAEENQLGLFPSPGRAPPLFTGYTNQQQVDDAVNLPLGRLVTNVGFIALGMACVVFSAIPRAESGAWRETDFDPTQRVVGFSSEVQLGELGAISESPEEVMKAYIYDAESGLSVELVDEPLFRGVVLTTYANRKWKQDLFAGQRIDRQLPPAGAIVTRQRFVVQPLDTDVLFSLYPPYSPTRRVDILWAREGEQLARRERRRDSIIEYEMSTTAVNERRQSNIAQAAEPLDQYGRARLLSLPTKRDGSDPLQGTKATAQRLVRDIPPENKLERARVLANFLRDPTNFRYSLGEVRRDETLDPVEDFVTNNPVGHCEYYASALALMLRAVNVPSRLAIGFKGGEWREDHYEVRAMDAHAWVEAYLSPDELPAVLPPGFDREQGGWLIVDPTGSVGEGISPTQGNYLVEGCRQAVATLRNMWRTYVLGLDYGRQQESVYEPLRNGIVEGLVSLTDRNAWKSLARRVLQWLSPSYWGLTNGGWFSWRGALAAIVIMLTMLSMYYVAQRIVRRLWRKAQAVAAAHRGSAEVEFYRRLETLLAERELHRAVSQTQREFALAVGGQLAESPQTKHAAPITRQLVEMFYRVRFGRRTLDSQEAAAVEQALSELAGALALDQGRRVQDRR